ncbi:putative reverse transcriptase zinc-binding domain-containing protein [Helianthus annuus]|nr:putative reverse transcriptase zinc-binding domain-containing protein [Helianthus annuus]
MNRVANWRPVYDIFESRLALWKSSVLSFGGRVTLIRSVLECLPSFFFSLFKAPVKVIKDLESMIKKFLWGGSSEVRKTHWVAWDRVSTSRKKGGLGISKLADSNLALLCKWGWRYKREKDHMWVKVVDAIHASGAGWSFLPVKKSLGGVWLNIVSIFNKPISGSLSLRNLFRGLVGRGDSILFWLDPWLNEVPLKDLYPNLFALEVVKTCSVRDRLDGTWLWKHDPVLDEEATEWCSLAAEISSVALNDRPDDWRWKGDSSGLFSVRSVREVLRESDPCSSFVLDWCKWVPKKCNMFVWRAEMSRIPTYDALQKRGIGVGDGMCPLCRSVEESADHLFTSCVVAVVLWQKISRWCRVPPIFAFSIKDLLEVHKSSSIGSDKRAVVQGILFTSCWCIWLARNRAVFSHSEVKVDSIFSEVRSLGFLWYKYRAKCNVISWHNWCRFVI